MKKFLALILATAMILMTLAACGGTGSTTMTMGTGGTSGTYYAYGGVLGNQIKTSSGITVNVVSTDGSKANILGIDAGNYQLGLAAVEQLDHLIHGEPAHNVEVESKLIIKNSTQAISGFERG